MRRLDYNFDLVLATTLLVWKYVDIYVRLYKLAGESRRILTPESVCSCLANLGKQLSDGQINRCANRG